MVGWTDVEKTVRLGVWLFRGALKGKNVSSSLFAAGDCVKERIVPHRVIGVRRLLDGVAEGCPGHGPVHLHVESAAEIGFH